MLFYIRRASLNSDDKPCDEAVRSEVPSNLGCRWFVEIKDLEHLRQFVTQSGECVIRCNDECSLLIYDTYIE